MTIESKNSEIKHTTDAWLVVNDRKVKQILHVLEVLRLQNVDLSNLTTCHDIKQLIQSMYLEIMKHKSASFDK